MNVSASDIQSFLRCRRSWDIVSPNRQSLHRIGVIAPALHIGTGVHLGLAAMSRGEPWREAVNSWADAALNEFLDAYQARVGMWPSKDEQQPFLDTHATVHELLRRYEHRYFPHIYGDGAIQTLCVEQAFTVPIPGTPHALVGTWDAVLDNTKTGDLWIVEHKTYSKKPNVADLLLAPQFSYYVWAAQQVFAGRKVAGVLYDGIAKKIPSGPDLLKSGSLSRAFNETVDWQSYVEALNRHGFNHDDYADMLTRLAARDSGPDNPYWTRYQLNLTRAQVEETGRNLVQIVTEMANAPAIYPTFRLEGCFDCQVRDLCQAMQHGEDTSWLIAQAYAPHEGNSSFRTGRVEIEFAEAA